MREIIVRYNDGNDYMAVRGGEYVRDLVRCGECKIIEDCPLRLIAKLEYCSYGERDGE